MLTRYTRLTADFLNIKIKEEANYKQNDRKSKTGSKQDYISRTKEEQNYKQNKGISEL